MTTEAVPAAPPANPPSSAPPAPPAPPPAPPAAPAEPQAPQKPAGDPRPRSQRIAAERASKASNQPPVATPPAEPPAAPATQPPAETQPTAAPPAQPPAPEPPATQPPQQPAQKTPEQLEQEAEQRLEQKRQAEAAQRQLDEDKAFFKDAKLQFTRMLAKDETTIDELTAFVDRLVDGSDRVGRALAAEDNQTAIQSAVKEVEADFDSLVSDTAGAFYDNLPEALHQRFTGMVHQKPIGEWMKAFVGLAHELPQVRQNLYTEAIELARGVVPETSRGDFDGELASASKDLKGLLGAVFQAGFVQQAPVGSRTARVTSGGAFDMERWRSDRGFRRSLSKEENQAYHQENLRQRREGTSA